MQEKKLNFSPLAFLASLGAGGIAVADFAFINYTLEHGKGLITMLQTHSLLSGATEWLYIGLEVKMALFTIIHFILTFVLLKRLVLWLRSESFQELINNPVSNVIILAPFISITMTLNVFIGSIRYYFPIFSDNFQALMLPGLIAWGIIWILLLKTEIKLFKISFVKDFDLGQINFGWLLHVFALAMLTVTGTGIAALSENASIAHLAFFMSLVSFTMGIFLLFTKLGIIFRNQFKSIDLPHKNYLPSILMLIPIITLFTISFFRIGHYLEHHQGAHLVSYFSVVMSIGLAIEIWYLLLGISLLKKYFKTTFLKEFHVSQWGLICPFVAFPVLSMFFYNVFWQGKILFWINLIMLLAVSILFLYILIKHNRCCFGGKSNKVECNN